MRLPVVVPMGLARFQSRLQQGIKALRPAPLSLDQRKQITSELTSAQAALIWDVAPFDQIHLYRVYKRLRDAGETDRDLLVAALLHDVGKRSDVGEVRLVHRVGRVLLRRVLPGMNVRIARPPARGWRCGFVLAEHHAGLGTEKARAAGCSERTCWLIAHHEDTPLPDDDDLRRLVEADDAV